LRRTCSNLKLKLEVCRVSEKSGDIIEYLTERGIFKSADGGTSEK